MDTEGEMASGAPVTWPATLLRRDNESEDDRKNDGESETQEDNANDDWDETHSAGNWSRMPRWTRRECWRVSCRS